MTDRLGPPGLTPIDQYSREQIDQAADLATLALASGLLVVQVEYPEPELGYLDDDLRISTAPARPRITLRPPTSEERAAGVLWVATTC